MIWNKSDKWTKLALLWAEEFILSQQEKANRIKIGENKQSPIDCSSGLFPQLLVRFFKRPPHLVVHCCLLFSPYLNDTFLITIFNMTIKQCRCADCFCTIPKSVMLALPTASCQLLQLLPHTSGTSLHFRPTWRDRCQEAGCLYVTGTEGWLDWKSNCCDSAKP